MPITKVRLDLGISEREAQVIRRIFDFLSTHNDLAFNGDELSAELDLPREGLSQTLAKLEIMGATESRVVRGVVYHIHRGELPDLS